MIVSSYCCCCCRNRHHRPMNNNNNYYNNNHNNMLSCYCCYANGGHGRSGCGCGCCGCCCCGGGGGGGGGGHISLTRLFGRRCSSPTHWVVRVAIPGAISMWIFFIVILWVCLSVEQRKVRKSPNTTFLYQGTQVCGLKLPRDYYHYDNDDNNTTTNNNNNNHHHHDNDHDNNNDYHLSTTGIGHIEQIQQEQQQQEKEEEEEEEEEEIIIETLDSAIQAREEEYIVGHCGECGSCSNPHDIAIYDETKYQLFATVHYCGKRGLLWGRLTATKCMDEKVGFTQDCTVCWVENIMCDLRYCIFTCLWQNLFGKVDEGDSQSLNRCTECDEKRCGINFVHCAGANRRRSGIISDITRDINTEICTDVYPKNWWLLEDVQELYTTRTLQRHGNNNT